jgi:putative aminopeptidase FrvX
VEFLKTLLSTPGPSSFEARVAGVWSQQAASYGAEVGSDTYGSAYATFGKAAYPKVMVSGHLDEIGLMITHINKQGFLFFKGIGGWDSQQLVGQRVRIIGTKGDVLGVIGKKAIHLMNAEDQKKVSRIEDLWIDIGANDDADAAAHVEVGSVAVLEQPYLELLNGRIACKAIDNRIGCYIALEAAHRAANAKARAQIVAVATVQEEINSQLGAKTTAQLVRPDVAIVVEVTHATDIPGVSQEQHGTISLGSGVTLRTGSVVHRGVYSMLVAAAKAESIPYSVRTVPQSTSTDADVIAPVGAGIPTAVVSIPNRYMHSANEMIDLNDLEQVIRLITAFITSLSSDSTFTQPPL